mgnify:CR=1 FL=1
MICDAAASEELEVDALEEMSVESLGNVSLARMEARLSYTTRHPKRPLQPARLSHDDGTGLVLGRWISMLRRVMFAGRDAVPHKRFVTRRVACTHGPPDSLANLRSRCCGLTES